MISENLLFIAKNGEKIVQIEVNGLADLFRRGKATPSRFKELPLTETILSKLTVSNPLTHQ